MVERLYCAQEKLEMETIGIRCHFGGEDGVDEADGKDLELGRK